MRYIILLLTILLNCSAVNAESLKFGIASIVSPGESFSLYTDLNNYIAKRLGTKVEPVIKRDYDEMNRMILNSEVDFASVCTGAMPYISSSGIKVIAVPEVNGKHTYKSLIITNKKYGIKTVDDLKGKLFAFTDRLSNTGTLYPTYMIINRFQQPPEKIFKKVFYTKSHDKSIYLVNKGVVQAAAVDSIIYNNIKGRHKEEVKNISILLSSPDMIAPPFVASSNLSNENFIKIRNILLNMDKDKDGKVILKNLGIDRFIKADLSDFESVLRMKETVDKFTSENSAK